MSRPSHGHFGLQVAACGICRKTICMDHECYRVNRVEGGLTHTLCLAAVMMLDDPTLSDAAIADWATQNAEEICFTWCENPEHATVSECRYDVHGVEHPVVGCSPDTDEEYLADHFHAIIDGSTCECRHHSWQQAIQEHSGAS